MASYNTNPTITVSGGTATLDGSAFTSGSTVSIVGTHTLIATDAVGNSVTITFTIDKTAPVVSNVTEGGLYNVNKAITFDEGTATLNSSAFTSGSTVSAEGTYTLVVTDAAGNVTTVHFTIDKTPPIVTGVTEGGNYKIDPTITVSGGTATLDGDPFTSGSTVSDEGTHTLIATDAAGNTATITFIIDKTAPVVNDVTEGGLYNVNQTITFTEGTATLDGVPFTSGSTVSVEAAHTLIVTDAAGNSTTVHFTIDKTPPIVTGVTDGGSYKIDPTITVSGGTATLDGDPFTSGSTVSDEGTHTLIATDAAGNTATITFTIDKTAPVVSDVTEGGLYNVNQTITFTEGTATLDGVPFTSGSTVSAEAAHTLIVTDAAGNSTTVHFTIDKTPPIVTGVTDGGSYKIDPTITVIGGTATLDGDPFTSGSTVSDEGTHTLIATDAAGNTATITFIIDKTAPVVHDVTEGGLYNVNQTITFNEGTATLNGSAFTSGSTVSAEGAHTLIVTDAAGNSTTVHFTIDKTPPIVTGVTDGGSYKIDPTITVSGGTATLDGAAFTSGSTVSDEGTHTLIATDAAGNTATITFTIDKTAPVVSDVTEGGLYNVNQTITFTEGTATLDGVPFTSGSTVSVEAAHTLIVTDAAGNSTTVHFTIDKTPPIVTGVTDGGNYKIDPTITVSGGTATLDGDPFTSGSTVSDEGTHTLIATDAAGNTATITFTIDKTAPVVSDVTEGGLYNVNQTITFTEGTATLDGVPFTSGSTVSVEAAHTLIVTDAAGNSTTVHFTIDKTPPIVTGVTDGGNYKIDPTITVSGGTATLDGDPFTSGSTVSDEGTHTLIATDAAGNTATITFIIDKTAPVVSDVTEGGLYNVNQTITFTEGTATLDGVPFTSGSTVSVEAAHTLIVTDAAGNSTTVHFTIDKTPPIVTGVTDGGSYKIDPTITVSGGTATLDGAAFTSGSTVSDEGTHTLIATDAAGNTATITFTIDKTAPVVSDVTEGGLYNVNQTITFNEGTATLDGDPFTSGSTVSDDGSHTLVVTDAAGNVTTVHFTIDTTPPIVTGVTDGGNYNTNQTITLDDGTATLDGALFTSGSTVSAEGTHTLVATDGAGNSVTITFTIDKTAPVVSNVTEGGLYNVNQIITFNEGTATLDSAPFTSGSTVSDDGSHTLVVTDAAGNTTTVHFTIDKTPPVVTGVTDNGNYNTDPTINFNEGTALLDGAAFTSGSAVSSEGQHTLVVTDTAGNITTISFMLDKTAPTGTVTIDNGAATTKQKQVTLTTTASDGNGVGGIQARFSNDNSDWTSWENVPATKAWTLTNGRGTKNVYMQLKDSLDLVNTYTGTILYQSAPVLQNKTFTGMDRDVFTLSVTDFVYANEDGTDLQTIKLVTLPEHGTLKLGENAVTAGQEIAYADANQLTYTPETGWEGTTKLVWNGSDGVNVADVPATLSFELTRKRSSSSGGSGGGGTSGTKESVIVIVNGVVQDQLATAEIKVTPDNKIVSTITIDEEKMNAKLEKEGKGAVVTIPFQKQADQVIGVLNGQMLKNMENKEATLQIQTSQATYTIPAKQIDIRSVSAKLDSQVSLKDVEVQVAITNLDQSTLELDQANGDVEAVAPFIEFKVTVAYLGKSVEVKKFNKYVERTISIPREVAPQKITTGVVVMPNGTYVHVPTKVMHEGAQYTALINSLTNSTYSVIYNEKTFADIRGHWSQPEVEDMASRLIVNGVDDQHFAPDVKITRAEFTAIVVRALGLWEASGASAFSDVHSGDWYATPIALGQEYGLVQGYSATEFAPNKPITREETMVVMQRAMKLAGHEVPLTAAQVEANLSAYADQASFDAWARTAAALCIQEGIIKGSEGLARPTSDITRAETAAIIHRMLQTADLINE